MSGKPLDADSTRARLLKALCDESRWGADGMPASAAEATDLITVVVMAARERACGR